MDCYGPGLNEYIYVITDSSWYVLCLNRAILFAISNCKQSLNIGTSQIIKTLICINYY